MPECDSCGDPVSMPFTCKFCEGSFCSRHRLPENHDCEGLRDYQDASRQEGKIGYDAMQEEQDAHDLTPDRASPGILDRAVAPLRGNATMAVLGIMLATFVLELSVPGFFEAFALDPVKVAAEPWRLGTSVFLHAGLGHLLLNSIVLYSFGPHVERMLGTERFLGLLFGAALASSIGFTLSGLAFGIGPAVGISGGLYGMVAFLAVIRPQVTVLAFFFIPLEIRHAVMFFGAMDTVNFVAHTMGVMLPVIGGFASAGHLSGLIAGLALGWYWRRDYRQAPPDILFRVGQQGPFGHRRV